MASVDSFLGGASDIDSFLGEDPPKPKGSGLLRRTVGDAGVTALKSAISVPEAAVGIADLVSGGRAGKSFESAGFRPKEAKGILDGLYSTQQREANARVADSEGFVDTAKAMIENPSTIAHMAGESVAPTLAGGVVARGAGLISKAPAWVRGAIGEGAVGAGLAAEGVRQQTEDGLLTAEQAALTAASGAGTGLIGAGGAKLAQRLGIGEIDTLLAGGADATAETGKGVLRRAGEGALVEGAIQEAPQSAQEQAFQNLALDRPVGEGVGAAVAGGMLAGGLVGGIAGPIGSRPKVLPMPTEDNPTPAPVEAPDPAAGALSKAASLLPTIETPAPVLDTALLDAETIQQQAPFDTVLPVQVVDQSGLEAAPIAGTLQPASIAGEQIDTEWTAFAPESGTRSIPRAEMPQIRAENRGAMINFLKARGIERQEQEVPADSLMPTQAEFSPEKVAKAASFKGGDRSILVSNDGYVLDGHHQWMAKREAGEPVKVLRLDAPIDELIQVAREFPSSTQAEGATTADQPATESVPAAAETPATGPAQQVPEPPNWRSNYFQARKYARDLGITVDGSPKLAELVKDIETRAPQAEQPTALPAIEPVVQPEPVAETAPVAEPVQSIEPARPQAQAVPEQVAATETAQEQSPAPTPAAAPVAQAMPDILTQPRRRYIARMEKEAGVRKDSPGYQEAAARVQDQYEAELDRASATLTFEQYNELNSESPESLNRQEWEQLRAEYQDGSDGPLLQRRSAGPDSFVSRADVEKLAIRKMGESTVTSRFRFLDYAELPAQIKKAATDQGMQPEEVRAVHWRGMTYMVDGRFPTAAEAVGAMFHEHYVHFGLRAKYGKGLRMKLGKLLNSVGGLKGVRELAAKQNIDLTEYARGMAADPSISAEDRGLVLMEELMAHMGETTGTLRRTVEEFVGMVRAWLRDNGYADLSRFGVTDLAFELRGARQAAIASGSPQSGPSRPMFQQIAGSTDIRFRRAGITGRARDAIDRSMGKRDPDPNDPFAEENRRLREDDKALWAKAKKVFQRQFAPGGLLPKAVFAEKITRDSEFQAVEFDVRHMAGTLEKAIKADYGVKTDELTPAQMKQLGDALAGRVDPSIPENTKVAIVAMRQYIDALSGEYVGILQQQVRDNLSGAEPTMIDTIVGNMGSYVHRSYQAFDDPKWFKQVPTETVNAARQYLINSYRAQGESAAEARRLSDVTVNEILKNGTAYDSMESFIAEGKLGAKDLSVMIKRKEIAPQIRALLGEYTDPRLNFAKSATKMGRLIWNQRFLDRVREMGMGTFLFEGKNRPADATTQIAGEQSDSYAPLNGLWTFPEVAQAFKDSLGKEQMSDLYRWVIRLNGMVKYGKTVLSPTTAMRNWQSAMFFGVANGHFDLTQMEKSWAAFREQVSQTATGGDLVYLRKLKQLGVVYDTPYAGEMQRLMEDARIDDMLTGKAAGQFGWFRQANQFAQGFYAFGDDFWKIIGWENEKANLIKAGFPVAEAEVMAAERIRNTYPTYSMVGKSVRWLSRFPLAGTFVSFPAEIVRTSANMIKLTASDLKSDNPGLNAIGRKRVAGMAMVSAGFYALSAMTAAALGVDDDEEEALRDLAADWQKNSTFLYSGRDADGKLRYFDMSFLDPYGYWKRPITAMMRDQPWQKSAAEALSDMVSPFFGADMTAEAIFQVLANKKGTGGQVYQENGDAVDQLSSVADHMRKALQPGFVSNAERLWLAANEQRREGSGQPFEMRDEVVSLLGWRASTLDAKTGLYYRAFEFTDGLSDARRTLNRTLRSANDVSDKDIAAAKSAAQRQHEQAFREMSRLVRSAQSMGMTRAQIFQTLKQSNISQRNIGALLNGQTPPMQISPQSRMNAIRQARTMQGNEQAAEVARRFMVASRVRLD